MELRNILEHCGLILDLSEEQKLQVEALPKKLKFNKGDVIIAEGGRDRDLYIIAEGKVSINLLLPGSVDKMEAIITLRVGQMFGEFALLDNAPRSATVRAETDVIVYKFDAEEFLELCKKDTQLGFLLMKNIAILLTARIRETTLLMRNTLLW
ncbi:MAG: cyclic nucleotide-binding domain-containing protein [bacterium]|nr:cyclic nucleotide-binding domain-containing protein [bacterium]